MVRGKSYGQTVYPDSLTKGQDEDSFAGKQPCPDGVEEKVLNERPEGDSYLSCTTVQCEKTCQYVQGSATSGPIKRWEIVAGEGENSSGIGVPGAGGGSN